MPNVRGRVAKQVKQLPPPLPGDGILRAVRASASSTTVMQKGRCEAESAMTGSRCAARAEIGADAAGVLPPGVEKPRAPDKTVRVIAEAHDAATMRAHEAGTDRKTIVSQAILVYCASSHVAGDLSQLIENGCDFAELYLAQLTRELEAGTLKVSVGGLERIVNSLVKLNSIREKSSSGAPANPAKLKEACYPPEYLKAYHEQRESSAAGDQPETW